MVPFRQRRKVVVPPWLRCEEGLIAPRRPPVGVGTLWSKWMARICVKRAVQAEGLTGPHRPPVLGLLVPPRRYGPDQHIRLHRPLLLAMVICVR